MNGSIPILYVIWSLEAGGAERVVYELCSHADRGIFRPLVCCLDWPGDLGERLEREGVRVFALRKRRGLDARALLRMAKIIRDEHVKIVATHLFSANLWGRIAARMAGAPVVIATEHSMDFWKRAHHFAIDRALALCTDRIVAVSEAVRTYYVERVGLPARKISVIHNGVDLRRFASAGADPATTRRALGLPERSLVVSIVGALVPAKMHERFLRVMAALDPAIVGLVVGDGPRRAELEALSRTLGVADRVRFAGFRADVPDILRATDILAITSEREGHPICALEAMAAGVPIVASGVGGIPEIVEEGRTGFLAPPGDEEALADRIARLARDPDLRRTIGLAGRDRVERRFGVAEMVRHTESLYLDALGIRRAAAVACRG